MFLEFFGLREQPFGMTPDPAYLYASRTHGEALASLSLGIAENRGFLALIAEPGMGKTTLLYQLLEDLRDSTRTVLVSQTQCTSREFVEYILQELGVEIKGMGLVAMHGRLNEILFEELLAGKRFVLVVDEAQNLDDSVLETVRMLSNFETHNTKLLQIILAGQPRLAAKLAQPALWQLRQRIAVLSHLQSFTVEETGLYIEHRLTVAGYGGETIFDPASITRIAWESRGIPRTINNICYNALFLAYTRGQRIVTREIVQEVVARLDLEPLAFEASAVSEAAAEAIPDIPVAPAPAPVAAPLPAPPVAEAPAVAAMAAAAAEDAMPAPAAEAARPAAAAATSAAASSVHSTPPPAPIVMKERRAATVLSYDAGKKISLPKWSGRSAIVAVVLLSGTLLVAILGRTESMQRLTPAIFDHSSDALGPMATADRSDPAAGNYDAAPQDTESGQVITVMAGPQQTLQDLSLKYVGHFDSDLSKKICDLNPALKDPDHLEAGQLIRIPLPPGAMKEVNDTADSSAADNPKTSGSLFSRFTAFLRTRK
jgi:general secretion pathway protein A